MISVGIGRQVIDGLTMRATANRADAKRDLFDDTECGLDPGFRFG